MCFLRKQKKGLCRVEERKMEEIYIRLCLTFSREEVGMSIKCRANGIDLFVLCVVTSFFVSFMDVSRFFCLSICTKVIDWVLSETISIFLYKLCIYLRKSIVFWNELHKGFQCWTKVKLWTEQWQFSNCCYIFETWSIIDHMFSIIRCKQYEHIKDNIENAEAHIAGIAIKSVVNYAAARKGLNDCALLIL